MRARSQPSLGALRRKFPDWDIALRQYLRVTYDPDEMDEKTYEEVCSKLLEILVEILTFFTKNAGVRDNWENPPKLDIYPFGQAAVAVSLKQCTDYTFGLYMNEFYLETYVAHPGNLNHVPNEFWKHIVEVDQFGSFSFQENALPSYRHGDAPKHELLRNARSNIYKLVRNWIFLEQWSDNSIDLGWFKVTWPCETDWETLLLNGSQAFKRLHKLNYTLYRYEYLRRKARVRPTIKDAKL